MDESIGIDSADKDHSSFVTSTPQKFDCKECQDQTQCTDCYVRQVVETSQVPQDGQLFTYIWSYLHDRRL